MLNIIDKDPGLKRRSLDNCLFFFYSPLILYIQQKDGDGDCLPEICLGT